MTEFNVGDFVTHIDSYDGVRTDGVIESLAGGTDDKGNDIFVFTPLGKKEGYWITKNEIYIYHMDEINDLLEI